MVQEPDLVVLGTDKGVSQNAKIMCLGVGPEGLHLLASRLLANIHTHLHKLFTRKITVPLAGLLDGGVAYDQATCVRSKCATPAVQPFNMDVLRTASDCR